MTADGENNGLSCSEIRVIYQHGEDVRIKQEVYSTSLVVEDEMIRLAVGWTRLLLINQKIQQLRHNTFTP